VTIRSSVGAPHLWLTRNARGVSFPLEKGGNSYALWSIKPTLQPDGTWKSRGQNPETRFYEWGYFGLLRTGCKHGTAALLGWTLGFGKIRAVTLIPRPNRYVSR